METKHAASVSAEQLADESKELFDFAEQDILEQHRQETGARIARAAKKIYEATHSNETDEVGIGDFFDLDELIEDDEEEVTPEVDKDERAKKAEEAMREAIKESFYTSANEYHGLKIAKVNDELMLKLAIQQARESDTSRVSTRSKVTDRLRERIESDEEQIEALANQNPESYVVVHGYEFRGLVKEIAKGEIARTPYVRKHLDRVEANMTEGRPTFIHGHLGSGKTELAIAAAKHSSISREAYAQAMEDFKAFKQDNPQTSKEDARAKLGKLYRSHMLALETALANGDSEATEKFTPLIISGSKDLTSQDMFTDKTLKLTRVNKEPILEQGARLDAELDKWIKENPEEAADPERRREKAAQILEIYKKDNSAFGTEVQKIEKEILRGVKEGRPVILDEANAIPAAVLISLNDILQRRPGQTCYIPGEGPTEIKDGFSLTLTGNLSTGNINYGGTDELNPAFLSRLDIIEHDYLPMSDTDPGVENQAEPGKNELFQVVVAYLADKHGDLTLPDMDHTLNKLFRLSQLAHQTQQVFEGKWRESNSLRTDSGDDLQPSLEQSVLSIRNLLNVLKKWDKGSEMDLDTALWEGFISSIPDANDQNFVLAMAKQSGFFSEDDGWQVTVRSRGEGFTTLSEAHPGDFNFVRQPLETCDLRNVVDMLYGKRPERQFYPDINLDEIEAEVDDEPTIEDIEAFREKLDEITTTISALEVLYDQCGCNLEQDS